MAYVPLHVHTEHSPLDGMARISDLANTVADLGLPGFAETDHGSITGWFKAAEAAKRAGVKFIPGMEAYMAVRGSSRFEREIDEIPRNEDDGMGDADEGDGAVKTKRYEHLTLLAINRAGWHNLIRFHNGCHDPNAYFSKPRGDYKLLAECSEGVIALTGCLAGPVAGPASRAAKAMREGQDRLAETQMELARSGLDSLIEALGRDNVYVEVMDHGIGAEEDALEILYGLAEEYDLPLVATNDSHYLEADEAWAHQGFLCVGTSAPGKPSSMSNPKFSFNGSGYHMRDEEEMRALRPDDECWQVAIDNTEAVLERLADDVVPGPQMRLPKFPVPAGFDSSLDYLRSLVEAGVAERYGEDALTDREDVIERVETELHVITKMGFEDYFLIVRDMIRWANSDYTPADWIAVENGGEVSEERQRKEPIITGRGRGSGAGSLACYALGITGVDPLKYGLLFERFLELGREGMPDIDTDFPSARQLEVFQYLQFRWGELNTGRIGSWGQAKTKAAIQDAARVLAPVVTDSMSVDERKQTFAKAGRYSDVGRKLSDLVPKEGEKPYTFAKLDVLDDAKADPFWDVFEELGGEESEAGEILLMARTFEDMAKRPSMHPCGFIVSPDDLTDLVPRRRNSYAADADPDDPWVICWDGVDCDKYGLLKLDVLGLESLDVLEAALRNVSAAVGEHYDVEQIPDPDGDDPSVKKAWDLFDRGSTGGVFQAAGAGMTKLIQSFVPRSLNDLSVAVAVYRPGPMSAGVPETYAKRKAGREEISYEQYTDDPTEQEWIDKVLGETYASVVFQEQGMLLGTVIAGFDASQRSLLRHATGKKKPEEMKIVGEMLLEGAEKEFYDDHGELISPRFSKETAARVFEALKGSASYSFNKSHTVAYGYLAYATAYLKACYPVEYNAAILEVTKNKEKRQAAFASAIEDGIEIAPPWVNAASASTSAADGRVVFGLSEIAKFGAATGRAIVAERDRGGAFTSVHQLLTRVEEHQGVKIDTAELQALIEAGALDEFGPRLGLAMTARAAGVTEMPVLDIEWDPALRSLKERQRLGLNLDENPLDVLEDWGVLDDWVDSDYADLVEHYEDATYRDAPVLGQRPARASNLKFREGPVVFYAVLAEFSQRTTRKGGLMANLRVEDGTTSLRGIIWPSTYQRLKFADEDKRPKVGDIVCVSGELKLVEAFKRDDDEEEDDLPPQWELTATLVNTVYAPGVTAVALDTPLIDDESELAAADTVISGEIIEVEDDDEESGPDNDGDDAAGADWDDGLLIDPLDDLVDPDAAGTLDWNPDWDEAGSEDDQTTHSAEAEAENDAPPVCDLVWAVITTTCQAGTILPGRYEVIAGREVTGPVPLGRHTLFDNEASVELVEQHLIVLRTSATGAELECLAAELLDGR